MVYVRAWPDADPGVAPVGLDDVSFCALDEANVSAATVEGVI
jgi:hypothetical protein